MRLASSPLRGVLALLAAGCGLVSGSGSGSGGGPAAPPAGDVATSVLHRDSRSGAPSFVWFDRTPAARTFASAADAARELAPHVATAFAAAPTTTSAASVAQSLVLASIDDPGRGPVVVRYRQRVRDLEVFRGGASVVLSRDLVPVAASGRVAAAFEGADAPFVLAEEDAVAAAHAKLVGAPVRALAHRETRGDYTFFSAEGLAAPARVKRVLHSRGDALEPAFYVEVQVARGPSHSFVISAADGRVLFENDLVKNEAFSYRVWADPETKLPMDGPQGNGFMPHPTGKPDGTKLTYVAAPLVSITSYPFSKNDPWLPADATVTTGNNVDAYADLAAPDGFSGDPDVRSTVTAPGVFDHVYDPTQSPNATLESKQGDVTHLFYLTNFLHDAFYDAGFDEKAGNHQKDNFGRGGVAGDPLLAETQDYSGRNNSNATVPADGASPRLQMFVFSGPSNASLVVNAPAGIAGTKAVGIAPAFGKDLFDLTGNVVLASDGQGADVADACEAFDADATGKIVLAHRGLCSFAQKAQNAQAAGAVGLVIANVATSASPTDPPYMGGTANGIDIPVLSLALADGQALEAAAVAGGANVSMHRSLGADLDGALDTTVAAHEWGHVLSGRLVGDGNGLTTNQAGGLGEGWADFTALLTVSRGPGGPTALGGVYPAGAYAMSGSGQDTYFGIRRVPYSVDFTKDPLTLKHITNGVPLPTTAPVSFGEDGSSNSEVHNTGEVWVAMLWECYVALVRDGRYSFDEARTRMRRYLVASLAATPVDPTILEARDAVLAAAYATDAKDFQTFFDAFARRGAGAGAKGPPKDSGNNAGTVESFASGAALEVVSAVLTDDVLTCDHDGYLDDGEEGSLTVTVRNVGSRALEGATVELTPKSDGIRLMDETLVKVPALLPFQSTKLALKTRVEGAPPTVPVDFTATLGDPSLPAPVKVTVRARYDTDEAPESSDVDHVDTKATSWKTKSKGDFGPVPWARATEGDNGFWTVPDALEPSDLRLTSPAFTIDGSAFTLTFRHKWSFRISRRRQTAIDGGVVEYSVDGGTTWADLSTVAKVDYNVTLDTGGRGDNPLKGRAAYGQTSTGYPDQWVTSKIEVKLPKDPESVMVRFRVGSGSGFASADGWFVDDIQIGNATSKPFYGFVPQQDQCDPNGPTADAGPGQTVPPLAQVSLAGSATHPEGKPLSYVWTQKAGPAVALRGADTATPSFEAPDAKEPTVLTFALRANDGKLVSAASRVDVTVAPADVTVAGDGSSCGCRAVGASSSPARAGAGLSALSLAALGAALARRRRRIGAPEV